MTSYLDVACEAIHERVRQEYLWRDGGSIGLSIKNLTERPFGRVKVEIFLPRNVEVYLETSEPGEMTELPRRPHPYGKPKIKDRSDWAIRSILPPPIRGLVVPSVERTELVSNGKAKRVSFPPMDLRASEEVELPMIFIVDPKSSDGRLCFTWEATATDAKGRIGSSLEVHFEQSDGLQDLVLGSLRNFLDQESNGQ